MGYTGLAIFMLILLVAMSVKIDSQEREVDACTTMMFQNAEYEQHVSERLSECQETLGDYRKMIDKCAEPSARPRINYMPYKFRDDLDIIPIQPYIIKNFTMPVNFTLPHLKTLNLTEKDFLVLGACNNSDPYSPCM